MIMVDYCQNPPSAVVDIIIDTSITGTSVTTASPTATTLPITNGQSLSMIYVAVGTSVGVSFVCFGIVIGAFFIIRRSRKTNFNAPSSPSIPKGSLSVNQQSHETDKEWEIEYDEITFKQEIGQ